MGVSKKMKYDGNYRTFICKRCGTEEKVPARVWVRKPQNMKNVCSTCIKKELVKKQTAKEKAIFARY